MAGRLPSRLKNYTGESYKSIFLSEGVPQFNNVLRQKATALMAWNVRRQYSGLARAGRKLRGKLKNEGNQNTWVLKSAYEFCPEKNNTQPRDEAIHRTGLSNDTEVDPIWQEKINSMHNQMGSFSTDENYKNQMEVVEIKKRQ